MENKEPNYIDNISKYCDFLCEYCPFTAQCEIYSEEFALEEDTDWSQRNERQTEILRGKLTDALENILAAMEKTGVNVNEILEEAKNKDQAEKEQEFDNEEELLEEIPVVQKAMKYADDLDEWLQKSVKMVNGYRTKFENQINAGMAVDQDFVQFTVDMRDSFEAIFWHQFFIENKIKRAIRGKQHQAEDDIQSDANGSAKAALIVINKCLHAWEFVSTNFPDKSDEILDMQVLLTQIKNEFSEMFPNASKFKRPGFDE